MASFDPASVGRLNNVLLPVVAARFEALGEQESGAYNFYKQRLAGGSLVADYEIEVAQALMQYHATGGGVHEIGAGYGQLPFLLALNGVPSVAIEADARRAATAEGLVQVFRAAFPLAAACRVVTGSFPLPDEVLAPDGATALTTNLVFTTPHRQRLAILRAMRRYNDVFVDVDRLFEKHDDEQGRESSLALIRVAGFSSCTPFLDLGVSGRYYRLVP
jgi:hypothetical protein